MQEVCISGLEMQTNHFPINHMSNISSVFLWNRFKRIFMEDRYHYYAMNSSYYSSKKLRKFES